MATVTEVILSDSLDERIKNGVETVTFYHPLTGQKLEIELGEANRKHFDNHLEKLTKYIDAAREVEAAPAKAVKAQAGEQAKIREWAKLNGYEVGDRGRIKAEIVGAYYAAQNATEPVAEAPASVANAVADPAEGCTFGPAEVSSDDVEPLADDEVIATEPLVEQDDTPMTDDEILAMLAEVEAEKGPDFTVDDVAAKVDNE